MTETRGAYEAVEVDALSDFDSCDGHLDTCWRSGGSCDCAVRLYRVAAALVGTK